MSLLSTHGVEVWRGLSPLRPKLRNHSATINACTGVHWCSRPHGEEAGVSSVIRPGNLDWVAAAARWTIALISCIRIATLGRSPNAAARLGTGLWYSKATTWFFEADSSRA